MLDFLIERIKDKLYKDNIRYTTDSVWYFIEVIRSDNVVRKRKLITKEEYLQGKRKQKFENICKYYSRKKIKKL